MRSHRFTDPFASLVAERGQRPGALPPCRGRQVACIALEPHSTPVRDEHVPGTKSADRAEHGPFAHYGIDVR